MSVVFILSVLNGNMASHRIRIDKRVIDLANFPCYCTDYPKGFVGSKPVLGALSKSFQLKCVAWDFHYQ